MSDGRATRLLVLRAVNRIQAKGSTARLAIPRDPEVVDKLGIDVTEGQLLSVGEYLEDHGYLELADISLTTGTYTITIARLKWLETGIPGRLEASEAVEEEPEKGQRPHSAAGGAQEAGVQCRWWEFWR